MTGLSPGLLGDAGPAIQPEYPLGTLRCPRVVRHHHNGSALGIDILQEVDHLLARLRVQVASRLIGEDHGGVIGEHPGQGHSLLLADTC